jgi:hypothetical protein
MDPFEIPVGDPQYLTSMTEAQWRSVLDTSLTGAWLFACTNYGIGEVEWDLRGPNDENNIVAQGTAVGVADALRAAALFIENEWDNDEEAERHDPV